MEKQTFYFVVKVFFEFGSSFGVQHLAGTALFCEIFIGAVNYCTNFESGYVPRPDKNNGVYSVSKSVFWPVKSKSGIYFNRQSSENLDNPEEKIMD